MKNKTFESRRKFIRYASKILVHEWNGDLKIFSRPFVIENSQQHLPLRTDILQTVVLSSLSLSANF